MSDRHAPESVIGMARNTHQIRQYGLAVVTQALGDACATSHPGL